MLGSPGPGVQADNFSVRWTTNRPFDRGTYRFVGNHDDGFKVEVNGQAPIDKMIEVATLTNGYGTFTQPGQYPVQLKYREYGGGATAQLRMEKASDFVVALDDNNNSSIELPDAFNKHGGYDRVGVPSNNVHLWGNGVVQDFDGGANGWGILMRRHNTTVFYYVSGKIWDAYRNEGGAPGWLGYPTSDPFEEGGVTRQNFEGGHITFNGQTATVHRPTPPVQSQPDPGSGGTNQNMEAFFGFAKGKVGITRLDGLYDLRGQCVTLIARYVQEVFLPANQRTVSRAFGHGKDTASVVARMLPNNFGPATSSGLPKRGAIISFPDIGIVGGVRYGHVGIVMESRQLSNGQRQVRIMDSNGDNKAVNSTVKEYTNWINIPNGTANGYGANIYWTNPK
ncbi:CHAP domain-containing protein [Microcoleus sp. AT3-D2]|uniref:CHAP domain-containing protein n=1 Tax=Microcoleus sp. AT3-D2 TaxID=2818612 RepID=UPI002FD3B567